MRFLSRAIRTHGGFSVIPAPSTEDTERGNGLTVFRGLLIAVAVSVLLWGICLTAVWWLFARK
jgi:hypothetical protein